MGHDVSIATVLGQPQIQENGPMSRNASYAMTQHTYEIVH